MSITKKIKTGKRSTDDDEFDKVKKYLLECPHVSADHPAIQAALVAVEKEQQRLDRDRKLQLKFSSIDKQTVAASATETGTEPLEDSVVVVDGATTSTMTGRAEVSTDEMMEWQDVEEKEKESLDDQTSYLGKTLTKHVIDSISEHKVTVKSPVGSVAAALHASLRSPFLGFSCTGIPEDEKTIKGGFAPPVRELPPYQFLPASWDSTKSNNIAIRYRKSQTGAVVLTVEQGDGQTITVRLEPANSKEPSSQILVFSLEDHVNLDSWNAALKKTPYAVSPALHYKSLSRLLTNFCHTFDLGSIADEDMNTDLATTITASFPPYVDNTVPVSGLARNMVRKSDVVPLYPAVEIPSVGGATQKPWSTNYEVPTTLGEAFPGIADPTQRGGDFVGDLAPAGLRDPVFPSIMDGGGRMGGNLLGPNHPLFRGGGGGGIPLGGPGSMQPRFDPIYPECIDFPNGGRGGAAPPGLRRSNRPSRSGEPNPDHLPPPNSFNDNMFS